MAPLNHDSIADVADFLVSRELALKKRFGQNLLVNAGARRKIVESCRLRPGNVVWEIGPGIGSLTTLLVERASLVVAFEIDRGFARALAELFAVQENLRVVEGDFLATWEAERERSGDPDRIVGNLPYSSAAAILVDLVKKGCGTGLLLCTVQKEIAERMRARPGSPSYSSFSVLMQARYSIREIGTLKPGSFYPAPQVSSSIVELTRSDTQIEPDEEFFVGLMRILFAYRRKTLKNNLRRGFGSTFSEDRFRELVSACEISPDSRADQLTVRQCLLLSRVASSILKRQS